MVDKKHPRKKRKIGNEKKSEMLKDLSNQSLGQIIGQSVWKGVT